MVKGKTEENVEKEILNWKLFEEKEYIGEMTVYMDQTFKQGFENERKDIEYKWGNNGKKGRHL
jgi:hypothetical protein